MNVDIDNFHDVRKLINENKLIERVLFVLLKSKFVSFDLEFTGVRFDNNERDKYDMFLNDKYLKVQSCICR